MVLFIGIKLRQGYTERVLQVRRRWDSLGLPEAQFPRNVEPHITLKAPFVLTDPTSLQTALERLCYDTNRFEIQLAQIQTFHHLSVQSPALIDFQRKLIKLAAVLDLPIQDNDNVYRPHTTIGRTESLSARQFQNLQQLLEHQLELPWHQVVDRVRLYGRADDELNYTPVGNFRLGTSGNW